MLDMAQRAERLLSIAREITVRGAQLMDAFDDNRRIDWFDNTASDLVEIVYADFGIPAKFVDDETGNLMISYTDGNAELSAVMDRLISLHNLVTSGGEQDAARGEPLADD